MNQKRIIFLSILIIGVLTLSLGVTFAIFNFNKTSTNSKLVVGDIYMHYNETNQLTIDNAMPFEGNNYFHNADITEEEVNKCVTIFRDEWGLTLDTGETWESYCAGTGTRFGNTFQEYLNANSISIGQLIYLEDNNVIKSAYSNLPYFEFTINGKNTTLDKNIYYEIKLDYGDTIEGKQTRIEDNLLKFTLIEYNNNIPKRILTDYSFPNLENQVIWSNTIDSETNEEIERTYRLYMWIDSNTKICSGELTTDCDYYTNQEPNWEDVFASIKVNVSGDFIEKDVHYNILTYKLLSEIEVAKENISEINFLNLSDEEINNRYQTATFKSNGVNPLYAGDNIKIWLESDIEDDTKYIMYIASDETIYFPSDSSNLFYYYTSVKSINFSNIDTSNVTDMSYMFSECSSLTSLDVSNFDTSNVRTMAGMFDECSSLTSLDISNFDTSNVIFINHMFYKCNSLTSLNLSSFNTSKVTNMNAMFSECSSLTSLNLSNFDTSNVKYMISMFYKCSTLTSLNLSNFDTSNVIYMASMFAGCSNLTSIDLSNFDTSNVRTMEAMFYNCSSLTSLDLSNFVTSKVTSMHRMFNYCSSLVTIYANSDWNTTTVESSEGMFSKCTNLVGAISYDSSKVTVLYANPTTGYFTEKSL